MQTGESAHWRCVFAVAEAAISAKESNAQKTGFVKSGAVVNFTDAIGPKRTPKLIFLPAH